MPEFLSDSIKTQLQEAFMNLQNPVEIVFFGSEENCDYCAETRQLLEEVTVLSEKLGLTIYDLEQNSIEAMQYKVNKAPGFNIMAKVGLDLVDYGIRFYGIPSGHEFTSLINDLVLVSGREAHLDSATVNYLKGLTKPIHLQVFTTPT
jgi:alkyl hydroperoxide reductase subunit AhpF